MQKKKEKKIRSYSFSCASLTRIVKQNNRGNLSKITKNWEKRPSHLPCFLFYYKTCVIKNNTRKKKQNHISNRFISKPFEYKKK